GSNALLARFGADGALDQTFGTNGKALVAGAGAEAVGAQASGKIVFSTATGVARVDASGVLDAAFGKGGTLTTNVEGRGLVVQPDDAIVVTGSASAGGMTLARVSANGALDGTFGAGGVVTIPRGSQGHAVARMPDGRLVAVGVLT